jgi:hypothetical protein
VVLELHSLEYKTKNGKDLLSFVFDNIYWSLQRSIRMLKIFDYVPFQDHFEVVRRKNE